MWVYDLCRRLRQSSMASKGCRSTLRLRYTGRPC
ncbi:MAG: hypothetical protein QOF21_2187, partial [Actinomycetota bacterium]